MRTRKSELLDIIAVGSRELKTVTASDIEKLYQYSIDNWNDETLSHNVKTHITKIYANPDGSCEVEMGVHSDAKEQ